MDAGGLIEGDAERIYWKMATWRGPGGTESRVAPYLSKFAVERKPRVTASGARSGRCLTRDYPTFFWRAQPSNPSVRVTPNSATDWYAFPNGHVFWRDCRQEKIQPAIEYCLAAPRALRKGSEAVASNHRGDNGCDGALPSRELECRKANNLRGAAHQDKTIP